MLLRAPETLAGKTCTKSPLCSLKQVPLQTCRSLTELGASGYDGFKAFRNQGLCARHRLVLQAAARTAVCFGVLFCGRMEPRHWLLIKACLQARIVARGVSVRILHLKTHSKPQKRIPWGLFQQNLPWPKRQLTNLITESRGTTPAQRASPPKSCRAISDSIEPVAVPAHSGFSIEWHFLPDLESDSTHTPNHL